MLGKLIKHEFKNTSKLMLIIYGLFAFMTVLGTVSLYSENAGQTHNTLLNLFTVVAMVFYVLSVFALMLVTFIYMSAHFYKTMYSSQGYLTHTLPAKTSSVFHAKLITSFVWSIISMILMFASILFLINGASGNEFFQTVFSSNFAEMNQAISEIFGMTFVKFALVMLVSLILGTLSSLLWIFTSFSIGQLFNKHKMLASVIAAVIMYIANQIISTIITFSVGIGNLENQIYDDSIGDFFTSLFSTSLLYMVVVTVGLYVACRVITDKHLNLE